MRTEERARHAAEAGADELWNYIRDPHPSVLLASLANRNLNDEMASSLARSAHATPEVLGALSSDARFRHNYPLKVTLCKNPRTPQKIAYSLLKFLKVFDLADISRSPRIPVAVRQRVEFLLGERIASMPSGVKSALAKRASIAIVLQILTRGDPHSISSCLRSPAMTEAGLRQVIAKKSTKADVIRSIAEDERWSLRYDLKYALLRHAATPELQASRFVRELKTADLRDLCHDQEVPGRILELLYAELSRRGETPDPVLHETYEIDEGDDVHLSRYHGGNPGR